VSTTGSDAAEFEFDLRESLSAVLDAYRYMGMPVRRYLLVILLPAVGFLVGTVALWAVLRPPLGVALPLVALGTLSTLVALVYPKVVRDRRRKQIRQRFHLFLTHLTVLSMTNIDRVEMFRRLANEDEYETLADEMGHLVALVDTWNQSLEDACRLRAKRVPSPLLSDFLERLAYVVGGGQQISEFLVDEQDSIIQEFVIRYEGDLAKLDVMKELYLSMILSAVFTLVFAIVIPLLLGIDPAMAISAVVGMYAIVQGGFVFAVHQISPKDPVWFIADTEGTSPVTTTRRALVAGVGLTLALLLGVLGVGVGVVPVAPDRLPLPIWVALPLTPLLLPGLMMRREEGRVKTRDGEFPSFIRALGAVESVKQSSTSNVLASLRKKDFGALTGNVDSLYKRLRMRIDSMASWRLFAAETGSYLIQKFGDMYVTGRAMGGEPARLGQVISKNLNEVLKVREQRQQTATTLIGVIYGLTTASTFSFFVGLEVVRLLMEISSEMDLGDSGLSFLLHPQLYDIPTIEFLLLCVVLLNALLSAVLIRVTDRGHYVSGLVHFVLLTWLGAVTAVVTKAVVSSVISV
jgi:flagellar protein FlaJ